MGNYIYFNLVRPKYKRDKEIVAVNYENFKQSIYTDLNQCYGKCSSEKERAYNECRELFYSLHGERFRILSANGWQFTVGFTYADSSTGELYFCHITKNRTYVLPVSECENIINEWHEKVRRKYDEYLQSNSI